MVIAEYKFNSSTDTLPTFNDGYTYSYVDVDNGDSTITRTITSDSSPTSISFSGKTGLVSVSYLDISNVTNMSYMFYGCNNLTSIDVSSFNINNVTDMKNIFKECGNLKYLDISNFKINTNCNTSGMFEVYGIENIGMLHCDNYTVNTVATMLCGDSTIWVQDTKAYEYEDTNDNGIITIRDYKEQEIEIDLPQPLRSSGFERLAPANNNNDYSKPIRDVLFYDEDKKKYFIKKYVFTDYLTGTKFESDINNGLYWRRQVTPAVSLNQTYGHVGAIRILALSSSKLSFVSSGTATEQTGYIRCLKSEYPDSTVLDELYGDIPVYYSYYKNDNELYYELIETDITEKLNFDTYNDSMYITADNLEVTPSTISTVIAMKEIVQYDTKEGDNDVC